MNSLPLPIYAVTRRSARHPESLHPHPLRRIPEPLGRHPDPERSRMGKAPCITPLRVSSRC